MLESLEWKNIKKDGYPLLSGQRVLTYSMIHDDNPNMAFRILDSNFVVTCSDVTDWAYLKRPNYINLHDLYKIKTGKD